MNWQDEGFVIGRQPHGETSLILSLLTRHHGRHAGYVRGGRKAPKKGGGTALEAGNLLSVRWRARQDEQLGYFTLEAEKAYAFHFLDEPAALEALYAFCACVRFLPERVPCEAVFMRFGEFVRAPQNWLIAGARFEFTLIRELGYAPDPQKESLPDFLFAPTLPQDKTLEASAAAMLIRTGALFSRHVAAWPAPRRVLAERIAKL